MAFKAESVGVMQRVGEHYLNGTPVAVAAQGNDASASVVISCSNHGDNTVFFRDSPYAKIYAVRAKAVKVEGGGYRKPNDSELAEQISGMEIMKILGPALDANESATITVMPGASHVVVGKTASSNEYATQAEKFFSGTFKVADPETGELHNNNAAGFRQAIVSMTRTINPSGDIRWFVNNVSATLVDPLTMNGLEENAFIHKASGHEQGRSQEKNQAVPAAPQNNQAPIDGSQPQRSTTVESHQSMPAQQGNASYSQSPPPQGMPHSAPTNGMQQPAAQQQNAYQAQQSNAQGAVQTPPQDFLDNQPPLEHQEHDMGYGEQSIDDLLDQDAAQDEDLVARAAAAFEDLGTGPNM